MEDIRALDDGEKRFPKELRLLAAVTGVMDEAREILATPDAGEKAVAAETEAIELLLQAKRMGKGGGGGGGSNPGGGGTAATASSAALADLGPGSDAASVVAARPVGQATGHAGREFPEEFKSGLDAYFTLLEGGGVEK
jgi:plasmid stability protein